MNGFQLSRMVARDIDAGAAKETQLPKKLTEISSSFMIDESLLDKACFEPVFDDSDGKLNILAHSAHDIPAGGFPDFAGKPHIKTARMIRTPQIFLTPPYAAGREGRRHGITNGFLNGCKIGMSRVGTPVGIEPVMGKALVYNGEVLIRNEGVGIKNNKIITRSLLKPVVPRESLPGVFFKEIANRKLVRKLRHNPIRPIFRTIVNHQYLKILVRLPTQTRQ